MSRQYKAFTVTRKNEKPYNENWEDEIKAYDSLCAKREREYREHFIVIRDSGSSGLIEEENDVLVLFLNGVSCREIAKQYEVEVEVITGLLEIIQAKLSLTD